MTRILVIDDELSIVQMLSAFLQEEGWQVLTASNGQEGLERLANARPAVVVSDVMMPVLDGWQLCSRMQADPRYQSIPVVLMSAVVAPTFASPAHVERNSGRFSMSSATAVPFEKPCSAAQWATRFAASFHPR